MRIPDALAIELLRKSGNFSDEEIGEIYAEAHQARRPVQDMIIRHGLLSPAAFSRLYAEELDLPYIELEPNEVRADHLDVLGEHLSNKYHLAVFDVDEDDTKHVALEDPGDNNLVELLKKEFGGNVKLHVTSSESLQSVLKNYRPSVRLSDHLPDPENQTPKPSDLAASLTDTIEAMLEHAVMDGTSDVHLDPRKDLLVVRFRVDGKLKDVAKIPSRFQQPIINQLKDLAKIDSREPGLAHDGKFNFAVNNQAYVIRLTTLPVLDGEKVVLHIVNEVGSLPNLNQLGLWGIGLKDIEQALSKTQGLILVTGGKSSGKSTTLLSLLNTLKTSGQSISTIEEIVTSRINGVNQTEVGRLNSLSAVDGLKAVVEQDVNIIMVDELRDASVMELGIQAANSGHLVIASINSTSTTQAITKLTNMGIWPFLSAAAIKLVIAEKLARRLCEHCREAYRPDAVSLKHIEKEFSISPNSFKHLHEIETLALAEGIGKTSEDNSLSTTTTGIKRLYRAKTGGCKQCNHTGYKGRVGLFEVLVMSDVIQKQIASGFSAEALYKSATKEGMIELRLDGLVKALRGITSIEEVA
jgi:type IV pilus assembly protein PilB